MTKIPSRATRRASQAVTINTVAELAGVSAMTVSNVLNNRPNVRERTREAVLKAARDLGYTPNLAARSLASAAAVRIGLFCRAADSGFLSSILSGAVEESSEAAAQLVMRKFEKKADINDMVATAEALKTAGVGAIVAPPPYCELVHAHSDTVDFPLPMVAISPGDELPGMMSVRIDDRAAAREMTAYLISLGHSRIGFVRIAPHLHANRTRYEGYSEALTQAGLPLLSQLVAQADVEFETGLRAAEQLLSLPDRPTAIFASNDDLAAAVVSVAHRKGIDIPGDLSVVGFDDGPLAVKIWPTLTTVYQPIAAISARAVARAIEIVRTDAETGPQAVYLPHKLVVRESSAPPRTS